MKRQISFVPKAKPQFVAKELGIGHVILRYCLSLAEGEGEPSHPSRWLAPVWELQRKKAQPRARILRRR
jgi:hypothetical protein